MALRTKLLGISVVAVGAWMAACASKDDGPDLGLSARGAAANAGTPGSGASSTTGGASGTTGGATNATGGTGIVLTGGTGAVGSGATGGTGVIDPSQQPDAGGPPPGNGMPEVCDGIDNDENGIIDDLDVGHDGVCDCLTIGTIGQIGPWSDGGDIFADWLQARSPQGAVALDDQVLTPELLAPLQVIVVLHVDTTEISQGNTTTAAHHPFDATEAQAFGNWVKQGGGAMTTIGYTGNESGEVANVNLLLGTVGMAYSATNIDLSGNITDWTSHPVTMGVSNIFTDNGVEPAGASGTTLARDPDGRIALQVTEAEGGHVIVWGDEWITYDSEWVDVENQQVELFWLNMLKWLSPAKTCQVPIPPGLVR
jgi:hypothetical protein